MADVVAIITGERGHREVVRPLAAVHVPCAVLDWEEFRKQGDFAHARFIPAVWDLVRAHPGAVIFTDMSSAFLAFILFASKAHGARVLLRLRGDPFAETRDQLRFHWKQHHWLPLLRSMVSWLLDPPLFAAVDHFVPVSNWIIERLKIQERASVVRIPINLDDFPQRHHQAVSPVRLISVTNFNYPQKVAALGRFLDSYGYFLVANDMSVTVAGTGIAWESFRTHHAQHAQFLGFVRNVAGLYAEHDVFVHFSNLDAFPYVTLEAQAAGLPVLVNPDCGMLEQVEEDVNGFFVDLKDRAAVEGLLLRLRDSVSFRAQLGASARRSVQERYALATIGQQLRALLPTRQ